MTERDEHFHVLAMKERRALVHMCHEDGSTSFAECTTIHEGDAMPPGEYLFAERDARGAYRVRDRFDTLFGSRAAAGDA